MDGRGASNMGGHRQLSLRCRVLPWAQARSLGMGLPTGWWLSQGVQEEKLSGPPPLSLSYHSAVLETLALLRPFWKNAARGPAWLGQTQGWGRAGAWRRGVTSHCWGKPLSSLGLSTGTDRRFSRGWTYSVQGQCLSCLPSAWNATSPEDVLRKCWLNECVM